jgi:hypothetical protein
MLCAACVQQFSPLWKHVHHVTYTTQQSPTNLQPLSLLSTINNHSLTQRSSAAEAELGSLMINQHQTRFESTQSHMEPAMQFQKVVTGKWGQLVLRPCRADSCCPTSVLREHKISRCMLQHRFQARHRGGLLSPGPKEVTCSYE